MGLFDLYQQISYLALYRMTISAIIARHITHVRHLNYYGFSH